MNETNKTNGIATALKISGAIVIFIGIAAGVVTGQATGYDGEFNFSIAFIYWAGGIIGGIALMGIGEIVNLLQILCNHANDLNPSVGISENDGFNEQVDVSKMTEQEYAEYLSKIDEPKIGNKSTSFFSIESIDSDETN